MAERVQIAQAIYEGRNGHGCKPWAHIGKAHQEPYLKDADAALAIVAELAPSLDGKVQAAADDLASVVRMLDANRRVTQGEAGVKAWDGDFVQARMNEAMTAYRALSTRSGDGEADHG